MEISGSNRFSHRKHPSTESFLGTYIHGQPQNAATNTVTEETELHEDGIFSTVDFSESSNNRHRNRNSSSSSSNDDDSPPSPTLCTPRRRRHRSNLSPNHKVVQLAESFGILAALPEKKSDSLHHFYQKTTLSSSSSSSSTSSTSSSRLIPKPPQERLPTTSAATFSRNHQHHSAPVNVPVLSMAIRRTSNPEFDEIDEEEADGEMLPPHEMVARARSPAVACLVLEGVGRTLRGRDLRQVRNTVLRRTGFLD